MCSIADTVLIENRTVEIPCSLIKRKEINFLYKVVLTYVYIICSFVFKGEKNMTFPQTMISTVLSKNKRK